jgi:uncharacterized protein
MSKFFETLVGTPNPSNNTEFSQLLENDGRRTVLKMGPAVSAMAALTGLLGASACTSVAGVAGAGKAASGSPAISFKPIPISSADAVMVPEGYKADVLIAWGDPIGDTRGMPAFKFDASNSAQDQELQSGTHHDGMYYFPLPLGSTNSTRGLLVTNHEYPDNALLFPDGMANWSLAKARKSQAALGCSVQEVQLVGGAWQTVKPSRYARRIHANTPMRVGGPAAGHALMQTNFHKTGHESAGTFNNCANGWTPWGTYLTCEENFSFHFKPHPEPTKMEERYELSPKVRFSFRWGEVDPRFDAGVNRNEPNHFGWVVEFDPYDPNSIPVKRTAIGRCSHEGARYAESKDGRIAIYTGDDRAFEYIYKFVTAKPWNKQDRAANRDLLDTGTLYVARFNADGSGDWVELTHGKNGLTAENGFDSQAAVCMFARAAGDRVGATKMDRPEWIAQHPQSGDIFCTLTNNTARGEQGMEAGNPANTRAPNRFGHIVRWTEDGGDVAAIRFRWETFVMAGDPNHANERVRGNLKGDLYASPDGLMIDDRGVIWVQTDMSPSLLLKDDHTIYGNNQMLALDPVTREAKRFLTGPRGCEITGACMTPDGKTMFVNIQHPGETGAIGTDPDNPRKLSNWPDFKPDGRPRSGTVVVRRGDGGMIGT